MCVCVSVGLAAASEPLVFVQEDVEEAEEEISEDGSAPWYLRVQELAHDSLIAATRAQLAKDARSIGNSTITTRPHGSFSRSSLFI